MRLPSGDRPGERSAEPAAWVVTWSGAEPSALATKIRNGSPGPLGAAEGRGGAFGGQEGARAGGGGEVTLVRALPDAFMTQRSARPVIPPRRTYAIRAPSGDQAGCSSAAPERVVSFVTANVAGSMVNRSGSASPPDAQTR